jgi:hypothetical protein
MEEFYLLSPKTVWRLLSLTFLENVLTLEPSSSFLQAGFFRNLLTYFKINKGKPSKACSLMFYKPDLFRDLLTCFKINKGKPSKACSLMLAR